MQSKLLNFAEEPEMNGAIEQPATAPGDTEPLFTGEVPADVIEEVARHMTGVFEYLLLELSSEGFTLKPYIEEDGRDSCLQNVTIPVEDWETFDFELDTEYTAAVEPRTSLYKAITGSDGSDTLTVTVTPCTDSEETWRALQEHPLCEPTTETDDRDPTTMDTFSLDGTETELLRNPAREALSIDPLDYHSSLQLDSVYDVKGWLDDVGTVGNDTVVLIALTSGHRDRDAEYLLTFTEVNANTWEPVGDSLYLPANTTGRSDTTDRISDVHVGGVASRPNDNVQNCLPDGHEEATQIAHGFYRPSPLEGMFQHVLKDSLTNGTFTLEMSTDYPMQITHSLESSTATDTDATVTNILTPVVSPS